MQTGKASGLSSTEFEWQHYVAMARGWRRKYIPAAQGANNEMELLLGVLHAYQQVAVELLGSSCIVGITNQSVNTQSCKDTSHKSHRWCREGIYGR